MNELILKVIAEDYSTTPPKPKLEKRWKMLINEGNMTSETSGYYNEEVISNTFSEWYKGAMIEVEVEV